MELNPIGTNSFILISNFMGLTVVEKQDRKFTSLRLKIVEKTREKVYLSKASLHLLIPLFQ